MNEVSSSETKVTPESKSLFENRKVQFLGFVGFLAANIGYMVYKGAADWIPIAGCVLFSTMAVVSFLSLRNDWSVEKEEQTIMRTFGYIVLVPVLLLVAIIAGFVLYSTFDSVFATIPSWAAVIIVLLILIYLKK
jgi:hypothetical protein